MARLGWPECVYQSGKMIAHPVDPKQRVLVLVQVSRSDALLQSCYAKKEHAYP